MAFADPAMSAEHRLTSANSINFGRLLPQLAYVSQAALSAFRQSGERPGFIVPSGNLGQSFAILLARAMGLPVGPVVLATNANRTLKDWHGTGCFEPRASIQTLANAMDVGNPSNFERLSALKVTPGDLRVELVGDAQIRARIKSVYESCSYLLCPHSATTFDAWWRLPEEERRGRPWIAMATAHPYKFLETVGPLVEETIDPPPALAAILGRSTHKVRSSPNLPDLGQALDALLLARPGHCAL